MTTNTSTTVWVVDDQEEIALLVEAILAKAGYNTRSMLSARSALDVLQQGEHPDLILLDIIMPEMDGYEFLQHLRRDSSTESTPVVMLTALGNSNDVIKSLKQGASDYCVKPVNPDDIINTVKRCLTQSTITP